MRKLVCAFGFLLLSAVLWSPQLSAQSDGGLLSLPPFVDSEVYELPGTVLNEWLKESKTQQEALLEAKRASENAEAQSNEALKAVNASLTSFDAYRKSTQAAIVVRDIVILGLIVVVVVEAVK